MFCLRNGVKRKPILSVFKNLPCILVAVYLVWYQTVLCLTSLVRVSSLRHQVRGEGDFAHILRQFGLFLVYFPKFFVIWKTMQ